MIKSRVISLDNSWCITVDRRMHITCCASAYQLICKRTTAVVRPEILTNSKTYTIFSNNLYYVFQQHISNIQQTKKGESLTYELDPLRTNSVPAPYQLLVSAKFARFAANILKITHQASVRSNLPSIFITKIYIPTNIESSDKNKGIERLGILVFCSILRTRPIVVRL